MFKSKVAVTTVLILTVLFFLAEPHCAFAKEKRESEAIVIGELPPLKGPKKTIAVLSFENKSSFSGELALGNEFSEMLTEALMKSGQFIIVARQELSAVIAEQDMAASTRFAASKTARKGKLIPAQIIIKGAVTEFEIAERSGTGGLRIGNLGFGDLGLSGSSAQAHVGVIVYIIDSTTGQVLDSQRVEGKAKSSGIGLDYAYRWFSLGGADVKRTPLGKATHQTIGKAVKYIASRLADVPWSGSVVKTDGTTAYINAGSNAGIVTGDSFTVFREEESFTDPITGAPLGAEKSRIGELVVSQVKDKYSVANITSSNAEIRRGDLVTE
jgi:curli biogenesis system outer membrane secretion channel CsgG